MKRKYTRTIGRCSDIKRLITLHISSSMSNILVFDGLGTLKIRRESNQPITFGNLMIGQLVVSTK